MHSTRLDGRVLSLSYPGSSLPEQLPVFDLGSRIINSDTHLPSEKARTLLRKLRDLNLTTGPVAVTRDSRVSIGGCLSLDGPAEAGVRYRVRLPDGAEGRLEIGIEGARMTLALVGPTSASTRALSIDVTCDQRGRACARTIGARVLPESTDTRALEHFLRRVVRALAG